MRLRLTIKESPFLNREAWRLWESALTSTLFEDVLSDAVAEAVRAVLPDDFPGFSVRVDQERPYRQEQDEPAGASGGVCGGDGPMSRA